MSTRKKSPKKPESDNVVPAIPTPSAPEVRFRSAWSRAVEAVRAAVGAIIDLADAAAEAVTKR